MKCATLSSIHYRHELARVAIPCFADFLDFQFRPLLPDCRRPGPGTRIVQRFRRRDVVPVHYIGHTTFNIDDFLSHVSRPTPAACQQIGFLPGHPKGYGMQFWDDSLRICRKCKTVLQMSDEAQCQCPNCGEQVWFYNFRPIAKPPELPQVRPENLFANPLSLMILCAILLFGLVALIGVFVKSIVAAACGLAVVGFGVFAYVRHLEARSAEATVELAEKYREYAEVMQERFRSAVQHYNALLQTGDTRIEEYFRRIYGHAQRLQQEAETLRESAAKDRAAISSVEERIYRMAERFVSDHQKWASQRIRPDAENYQRRKLELEKAFEFVIAVGYALPKTIQKAAIDQLKADFKEALRVQTLKEEQRAVQQKMRDEERLRREAQQAIAEAEAREAELELRLEEALRQHKGEMDSEVQKLRDQLAEVKLRGERAKSMAEQTKVGNVYVLSNIGSFGESVFKVGMTRRFDPMVRVVELGDASVPFPFDVHAMIACDDAPALESALHRELTPYRVNRINLRKEYFRVELDEIFKCVEKHHGRVEYVAEPEALQYRETLKMTPQDVVELRDTMKALGADLEDDNE